jgi:predicted membrane-bound spermidine synthase
MSALLSLAFFLSGAAALVFETLWFRQAGLMLGNSVWASSLVMAAFMAGLATGNTWAALRGQRLRRPLVAYAVLEVLVGATGLALVLAFPHLTHVSTPVLRALVDHERLLNGTRMVIAFVLMVVPAAAMGATLPLLVRALSATEPGFGRVLGRLYGWNTLGAVAGALGGEAILLPALGVRGTGCAAAGLNLLAAAGASVLAGRRSAAPSADGEESLSVAADRPRGRARRLLAAGFLAGGTLLALEVVWFRFLLLFVFSSALAFSTMLSVVLLGIGLGGLLGAAWLRGQRAAAEFAPLVPLGCGIFGVVTYAMFARVLAPLPLEVGLITNHAQMFFIGLALMFPSCIGSGVLFTLLGDAVRREIAGASRAAGLLTLANTAGAALGALAGGLLLLPLLGVERSIFALSLAYGLVGGLAAGRHERTGPERSRRRVALAAGATAFGLVIALFPFGLMRNHYVRRVLKRWASGGGTLVAYREGVTESVFYVRRDLMERPLTWHLATNGFSMSDTGLIGRRYMRLFVNLPIALRPEARSALLISFGVGSTASALTDTRSLERIDVVDISRDILEMGRVIFGQRPYPLDDPRVRVHVEDGRFFLLTTCERFDLITAEPPPPKNAGIVNLYTREHFQLMHDRLADGGVATYWLPVYQMEPSGSRAIAAAFCAAFPDCTLWTGAGEEWILAGTRELHGPVDEAAFTRQWRDPVQAQRLQEIGVDTPEQLGALFVADAAGIAEWTSGVAPLDDDHPLRLSSHYQGFGEPSYPKLMDVTATRGRFEASRFVRDLWPPALRARTLAAFDGQAVVNEILMMPYSPGAAAPGLETLEHVLAQTSLRAPVLWMTGSTSDGQRVADEVVAAGRRPPEVDELLGGRALADRDYRRADELLARAQPYSQRASLLLQWRVLARLLAGDRERAAELLRTAGALRAGQDARSWTWLDARVEGAAAAGSR